MSLCSHPAPHTRRTHPEPSLSQRGAYTRQRLKDHLRFRRRSYRVQFTLGHTTFTITGPDFFRSGFSRHMPLNFAFAINALTAAEAPPLAAVHPPGRRLLRMESDQGQKAKQPYAIAMKDGSPFGIGALWENWRDPTSSEWVRTFAIITTDANELVAEIHDRMPLISHPPTTSAG